MTSWFSRGQIFFKKLKSFETFLLREKLPAFFRKIPFFSKDVSFASIWKLHGKIFEIYRKPWTLEESALHLTWCWFPCFDLLHQWKWKSFRSLSHTSQRLVLWSTALAINESFIHSYFHNVYSIKSRCDELWRTCYNFLELCLVQWLYDGKYLYCSSVNSF